MQYRTVEQESSSSWGQPPRNNLATRDRTVEERIERMVAENAVVIFSVSTCCMCTAMKRLFTVMGVSPTVHELDLLLDPIRRKDMERALSRILGGGSSATPVVFVGGKLVGSMDRVMASHISGTLVPLLKQAGALWL